MIHFFTEIAYIVGISPALLTAICWQESHHQNVINWNDGNSHSYGVCQLKLETAKTVIPGITENELMIPPVNIFIAAKYLKRHIKTYYREDIVISRYNGGYKNGKITNQKYVNSVLKHKKNKSWIKK